MRENRTENTYVHQIRRRGRDAGHVCSMAVLLVLVLLVSAAACGCADVSGERIDSRETVIVGVDSFEPYSYLDINGNFGGIDIELARKAFRKLGYEPEFRLIEWARKDEYLADGTIDCIWSCYSMTDGEDRYQWAGPYMYSRQVIAVRADSDIHAMADLAGKRVGVQTTTKAEELLLGKLESPLPKAGVVNSFSMTDEMLGALRKGYVDAIAGHEAFISGMIAENSDTYRILSESPYISQIGVAFEKETHEELAGELTQVLIQMKQDGTLSEIVSCYGLDPAKVVGGGDS